MTDIVDELKADAFNDTYDVNRDRVTVSSNLLVRAAREIEQLRAISGVVDALHKTSFREIKDEINGAPV